MVLTGYKPPERAFPRRIMSGLTFSWSTASIFPVLAKPVCISSAINRTFKEKKKNLLRKEEKCTQNRELLSFLTQFQQYNYFFLRYYSNNEDNFINNMSVPSSEGLKRIMSSIYKLRIWILLEQRPLIFKSEITDNHFLQCFILWPIIVTDSWWQLCTSATKVLDSPGIGNL